MGAFRINAVEHKVGITFLCHHLGDVLKILLQHVSLHCREIKGGEATLSILLGRMRETRKLLMIL